MSERYVVVRLVTGETLMATLGEVSKSTTKIKDPIQLKTVQVNTTAGIIEKTITSQFCSIAEDSEYMLLNNHIVFMKNLHPLIAAMYVNLLDSMENPEEQYDPEDLMDYNQEPEPDEEPFFITPNPNKETIH